MIISQSKMSELLKTWNQAQAFFGNINSNVPSETPPLRRLSLSSHASHRDPNTIHMASNNLDPQLGDIHRNLPDLSFDDFDILAKVNNSLLFIKKSRNLVGLVRNLFIQLFSSLRREVAINDQRQIEQTLKKISLIPLLILVNSPCDRCSLFTPQLALSSSLVPWQLASVEYDNFNIMPFLCNHEMSMLL